MSRLYVDLSRVRSEAARVAYRRGKALSASPVYLDMTPEQIARTDWRPGDVVTIEGMQRQGQGIVRNCPKGKETAFTIRVKHGDDDKTQAG